MNNSCTSYVVVCNVQVTNGSIKLHVPRVYQKVSGHRGHQEVESGGIMSAGVMVLTK